MLQFVNKSPLVITMYSASVCHILDTLVSPLMISLTYKLQQYKIRKERLLLDKQHLQDLYYLQVSLSATQNVDKTVDSHIVDK